MDRLLSDEEAWGAPEPQTETLLSDEEAWGTPPAPVEAAPPVDPRFPYSADNPPPIDRKGKKSVYPTPDMPGAVTITGRGTGTMANPAREAELNAMFPAEPPRSDRMPAEQPLDAGEFTNAFVNSASSQNIGLTAQSMLAYQDLTGDTTFEASANDMLETAKRWKGKIKKPKVPTLRDIDIMEPGRFERLGDWMAQATGNALGSSVLPLAGGFTGAAIGNRVGGKLGGKVGAIGGAFAGSSALNIGSMRETLLEEGVTDPQLRGKVALYGGMAMSSLDALVPSQIAGKLTGSMRKEVERAIIRRMLHGAKAGAIKEGLTEGAQTVIEELLGKTTAGKPIDPWQLIEQVVESAAQGALGGGVMQGATDAIGGSQPPPPQTPSTQPSTPQEIADFLAAANRGNAAPQGPSRGPEEPAAQSTTGPEAPAQTGRTEQQAPSPEDEATRQAFMDAGIPPEDLDSMSPGQMAQALEDLEAQGAIPPGTKPPQPRRPEQETPIQDEPLLSDEEAFGPPQGTRRRPVKVEAEQDLEAARPVVNPEPSDAQKAAGNYQKGHVKIHGLDVTIENPKGGIRRGTDEDGETWESPQLPADYGYIKRTNGKDGDQLDVYIGPDPQSDKVYVIDQNDPKTGKFDEHKTVLGAGSVDEAVDLYVNSFDGERDRNLNRIGHVTEMTVDEFKAWKDTGDTKKPFSKNWKRTPREKPTAAAPKQPDKPQQAVVQRTPIRRNAMEDDTAITSAGREVPVRYAVVDAKDLVASQNDEGGSNPNYPAEMQPRDRERAVSAAQIQDIANKLNPRLLDKSPKASDGAPIVADDGVVESGNGRVLAIRRAYAGNLPGAAKYREHLAAQGYPVEGMEQPVLVRIRSGEMAPEDRQAFTTEANARENLGMSPSEQAFADAGKINDNMLQLYRGGDIDQAGNRDLVKAFMRDIVPANERADLVDKDGAIAPALLRRIEAALLAKAYGDAGLVQKLTESTDVDIKAIGGALLDVAPGWAQMVAEAKAGSINPASDQTERLLEAVRAVERSRKEGQALSLLVDQTDMFSGTSMDPMAVAFLGMMYHDVVKWTRPMGRAKLANALRTYVEESRKTSAGTDLLGEAPADPRDIAALAKRKQADGQPDTDQQGFNFAKGPSPDSGPNPVTASQPRPEPAEQAEQEENVAQPDGEGQAAEIKAKAEKPAKASKGYGEKNTFVKKDRAAELRAKLKAKLDGTTLGAGIDPEMLAMGAELAAFHIEAGARKFTDFAKAIAADLGTTIKALRPYLRSWYNGARDMMEDGGLDVAGMDTAEQVKAALKELDDAPSSSASLEPDSPDAGSPDRVGSENVPAQSGEDGQGARTRRGQADQDERPAGGRGLPQDYAPVVGEDGHLELPLKEPGSDESDPADSRPERGADDSPERLPAERGSTQDAIDNAEKAADLKTRRENQRKAESTTVKVANAANVAETLPMLFPEQQDDVYRAELRYDKPNGHGMLFTNGTGTGKTYSGLGVAKRFHKQGKKNILIVAPSQGIITDWIKSGKDVQLEISALESTTDAGKGVVATTYANLGQNRNLVDRKWDLVIADEAHKLSSDKDGSTTSALETFRALTMHSDGLHHRARHVLRDLYDKISTYRSGSAEAQAAYKAFSDKATPLIEQWRNEPRPKALLMSATPFSYHFSLDYAEGYLFEFDRSDDTKGGYNRGGGREQFYMQNLGYRMRYNKLTKPEASVQSEIMERELHEKLKREGSLWGRALEVEKDYDRKFVLVHDAIGTKIDEALKFLNEADDGKFRDIAELINKQFDYLTRRRLLEAMKARAAIPYIKKSLALGRKVVVFHDYNEGGGINPFDQSIDEDAESYGYEKGQQVRRKLKPLYDEFIERNPYVKDLKFSGYRAPIAELTAAFPDAMLYNGNVSTKQRNKNKADFNTDGNGKDIIIVQSAAGEAGISLHDITNVHQRVLLNLGMPNQPTTSLQQEGRIYRVGQASDALFRYMNTGTNWERWTFAGSIAERSGTAENLALGNQARTIRLAFIDAFQNADDYQPEPGEGKGGKELDRATNQSISEFDKAKTHYFAQQKNTKRRDQREGTDYFATPEPLGYKMVQWANLAPGEKILEPSAGHGAIARYFPEDSERTLVEPSSELASRAALNSPGARVVVSTFEAFNLVNKYDAIVMNPPFGSGGKTAMDHLAKAAKHLKNGGRIVALIPRGGTANKRFDDFMEGEENSSIYQVADLHLPAVTFERAGTSVLARIVILEKHTDEESRNQLRNVTREWSHETIKEFFDTIEHSDMPRRVAPVTKEVEAAADGTVTVGGANLKLYESDRHAYAAMMKAVEADLYGRLVREARKQDGKYVGNSRAFEFANKEKRQAFLDAMGKPEEAPKPMDPGTTFRTAETIHAKRGIKLFVATPIERVGDDVFREMSDTAKRLGGYYSYFKGSGAIPGFQFNSEADRAAFIKAMTPGDAVPQRKYKPVVAAKPRSYSDEQLASFHGPLQQIATALLGHRVNLQVGNMIPGEPHTRGDFTPVVDVIRIAMAVAEDPVQTFGHELFHLMRRRGLVTKPEWAAIRRWAEKQKMATDAAAWYSDYYSNQTDATPQEAADALYEEVAADAFGDIVAGKAIRDPEGIVTRILKKVRDFLEAFRNWLNKSGFRTAEDIMTDMATGGLRGRKPDPQHATRILRKKQEPAAQRSTSPPQTETEAFKRWFGNSKVVDAQGRPLRVYHGTTRDFEAFDTRYKTTNPRPNKAWSGDLGTWFAAPSQNDSNYDDENAEFMAASYTEDPKGQILTDTEYKPGANVMPVYLSIQNPMEYEGWEDFQDHRIADDGKRIPAEEFRADLIAQGYDGIVIRNSMTDGNVDRDDWVAFEPTQIKSAIGNNGNFDPADPAIQRSIKMPPSRNAGQSFVEPVDQWRDIMASNAPFIARISKASLYSTRRALEDKMSDMARIEKAIEDQTGNPLNAALRVYQTEALYAGRTGERLEDFRMDDLEPLAKEMHDRNVTREELDDYLYARHAPERNAYIASINPQFPDGGSGMTDAEAQQIMASFGANRIGDLQAIAARMDRIRKATLTRLLNKGIIDQATHDSWDTFYQHYVPLRGFETDPDEEAFVGIGKGKDTRTKIDQQALGRKSKADSPTAYLIAQAQQSIILAEKARVGRALLRIARKYPNGNLWEVDQKVVKKYLNKNTGLVSTRTDNTAKVRADNVLAVREGGKLYWITLHHDGLKKAFRGSDADSMNTALRLMLTLQRYYAMTRTSYDPQFFIPNFLRDVQTASIHISAEQGKAILARTVKNIPVAMKGVWKGERGNLNSPWAARYREFALAGGKTGFFGLDDIEAIKGRIEREILLLKGGPLYGTEKAVISIFKLLNDMNAAVENAVRLSLYEAMRNAGYSQDEAAYAAKEVTVNFNRTGNWSKYMNAFYVFFKAGVNGNARVVKILSHTGKIGRYARRAAYGLFLAGIAMDLLNGLLAGDDDDDGLNDYDQIPEWIRERNYIIMLPGTKAKGDYLKIPMPWVYNVFQYAGVNLGRTMRGKVKPLDAAANTGMALLQAMNPLQAFSLAQTLTPTMIDPAVELYANKDWKGDPIMPEDRQGQTPTPDSSKYWGSVNPVFKELTDFMNSATGGDEIRPGSIDVSPESVGYIAEFIGGGVASTINQISSTVGKVWRGEELDWQHVPFVRKVYGTMSSTEQRNTYYPMRDSIHILADQIDSVDKDKSLSKTEREARKRDLKKQYPVDYRAKEFFDETDKRLKDKRKIRNSAGEGSERAGKAQEYMDEQMAKARKRYRLLQEKYQ